MKSVLVFIKINVGRLIAKSFNLLTKRDFSTRHPFLVFKKNDHHIFFGYYDKSPLQENKVLSLAVPKEADEECIIKIGYFDCDENFSTAGSFIEIGETSLWNWQQGSRLMWHPTLKDVCLYNAIKNNKPQTVVFNLDSKEETTIPFPIYDISPCGQYLLSLDFQELAQKRPGYGYPVLKLKFNDSNVKSTVTLFDIINNQVKFVISKESVQKLLPSDLEISDGYFNHLSFSRSGKNFIFYFITNDKNKRLTYAFVCPSDKMDIKVLGLSGFMSHYTWIDDDNIVIFTKLNKESGYYLFNINEAHSKSFYPKFPIDGHPSFINNYLITDCYPMWPSNRQKIFKLKSGSIPIVVATFQTPFEFNREVRCDLHPRISSAGVFCDYPSCSTRVRQMALIKMKF